MLAERVQRIISGHSAATCTSENLLALERSHSQYLEALEAWDFAGVEQLLLASGGKGAAEGKASGGGSVCGGEDAGQGAAAGAAAAAAHSGPKMGAPAGGAAAAAAAAAGDASIAADQQQQTGGGTSGQLTAAELEGIREQALVAGMQVVGIPPSTVGCDGGASHCHVPWLAGWLGGWVAGWLAG
jgi:hypothetical protein